MTQATAHPVLKAHGSVLQTGIHNGKIAMWLFLGSEVMFFTGLIGAYIVLRFAQPSWPDPTMEGYPLNVPLTAVNTFFLVCSSCTFVAALMAIQRGDQAKCTLFLLATTIIGALFVGIQGYEYYELYHMGTRPDSDMFGSCFYTMTGFHGFHVLLGVIALAVVTVMSWRGHYSPRSFNSLEYVGLYWHFVDLVWIVLFPIVYLM